MTIPFTQYLMPDGRQRAGGFERPPTVEAQAAEVIGHGYQFECEVLPTGGVSLMLFDPSEEVILLCELAENGPGIREAIDRLVARAHAFVLAEQDAEEHRQIESGWAP